MSYSVIWITTFVLYNRYDDCKRLNFTTVWTVIRADLHSIRLVSAQWTLLPAIGCYITLVLGYTRASISVQFVNTTISTQLNKLTRSNKNETKRYTYRTSRTFATEPRILTERRLKPISCTLNHKWFLLLWLSVQRSGKYGFRSQWPYSQGHNRIPATRSLYVIDYYFGFKFHIQTTTIFHMKQSDSSYNEVQKIRRLSLLTVK